MRPKWQDGRVISEPVPDFGSLEVWSRECGWLLPVAAPGSGTPLWLVSILDYAWNNDCFFINFDMDADIDEQFQTYDW